MFRKGFAGVIDFILQALLWVVIVTICGIALVFSFAFPPFAFVLLVAILIKVLPRIARWAKDNK